MSATASRLLLRSLRFTKRNANLYGVSFASHHQNALLPSVSHLACAYCQQPNENDILPLKSTSRLAFRRHQSTHTDNNDGASTSSAAVSNPALQISEETNVVDDPQDTVSSSSSIDNIDDLNHDDNNDNKTSTQSALIDESNDADVQQETPVSPSSENNDDQNHDRSNNNDESHSSTEQNESVNSDNNDDDHIPNNSDDLSHSPIEESNDDLIQELWQTRNALLRLVETLRKQKRKPRQNEEIEFAAIRSFVEESVVHGNILLGDSNQRALAAKLVDLIIQYLLLSDGKGNRRLDQAIALFTKMLRDAEKKYLDENDVRENSILFGTILHQCATRTESSPRVLRRVGHLIEAFDELVQSCPDKLQFSRRARNVQLSFLANHNRIDEAVNVLDTMVEKMRNGSGGVVGTPNKDSFRIVLKDGRCPPWIATQVIKTMIELSSEDGSKDLQFKPDHLEVLGVLASYTRYPRPTSGKEAEDFLRWSLSCHDQGSMDLSKIRIGSALARVLEAWSVSTTPESGPRSDVLMNRILDQYIRGGRAGDERPYHFCFAWNCIAWIHNSNFDENKEDRVHEKVLAVVENMRKFGGEENWQLQFYREVFWTVFVSLEEATKKHTDLEAIQSIRHLVYALVAQMEDMGLAMDGFVARFGITPTAKSTTTDPNQPLAVPETPETMPADSNIADGASARGLSFAFQGVNFELVPSNETPEGAMQFQSDGVSHTVQLNNFSGSLHVRPPVPNKSATD